MALQMILCLETNKRSATDYVYIKDTINRFFCLDNKIKISPIYMNGKSNYNSKKVKKEIAKLCKDYVIGETRVIYVIDTDAYEVEFYHSKELQDISQYCSDNKFDLVWFCHDVEEVYIGEKVPDNQKVSKAQDFRKRNKILEINEKNLMSNEKRNGVSNILLVLDKYIRRK